MMSSATTAETEEGEERLPFEDEETRKEAKERKEIERREDKMREITEKERKLMASLKVGMGEVTDSGYETTLAVTPGSLRSGSCKWFTQFYPVQTFELSKFSEQMNNTNNTTAVSIDHPTLENYFGVLS